MCLDRNRIQAGILLQTGRQAQAELGVALELPCVDRLDGIPETTPKEFGCRYMMDARILASILAIRLDVRSSSPSQPGLAQKEET